MTDLAMMLPELIERAMEVRERAHAIYSGFNVGAAVLTSSDQIFVGCNVENASFGLSLCAERNAVSAAVAAGHNQIRAVVVAARGGASPCGACRQFIYEFGNRIEIVSIDAGSAGISRRWMIEELLPYGFGADDLTA